MRAMREKQTENDKKWYGSIYCWEDRLSNVYDPVVDE